MKRATLVFLICCSAAPQAVYAINCNWNNVPTNINFGTYFPFSGTAVTGTSTFQIKCTPPGTGIVTLSRGSSATYNPRTMTRTAAPVTTTNYNLYMDAANAIIWGDGTGGTQVLTFTPVPGNIVLNATIYGTVPAGLDVRPGTYTDTIQATLNWGTGIDQRFFTVTVNVAAECTVSTSAVNFGAYDPVSANATTPRDSTGTVNVYCTTGTLATVSLDLGTHASGSTRRMLGTAGDFLTYEIYNDSSRTVVWNAVNTDSGTSASRLVPINNGFTAYARIPPGQDVGAGSYNDIVLVTVNY